jgi:hypothetical protein
LPVKKLGWCVTFTFSARLSMVLLEGNFSEDCRSTVEYPS